MHQYSYKAMKRYIIGILMAIMPAAFVAAQDKGISTVKDGQTAVGNTFNTDTAKQDSTPALSKRELRRQRVARRNLHYNILDRKSVV